ncbi:hypothetical protein, partial [Demequina sp.]|uniref:hypothetical protein n=1 Tax=Demequina sp. TaxID=2050685 RepID=UPI0025C270C7
MIASVVGVVVLLGAVAAAFTFVIGGNDDGPYEGPATDLVVLEARSDGEVTGYSIASFGSEDRPVTISDSIFQPATLLGTDGVSIASVGGPIIGGYDQDGDYTVVSVDHETGSVTRIRTLDSATADVYYDPKTEEVVVVAYGSEESTGYVGTVEDGLSVVARGQSLRVSSMTGSFLALDSVDDGYTYELTDKSGVRVLRGNSLDLPAFAWDDEALVVLTGETGSEGVSVFDATTGTEMFSLERADQMRTFGAVDDYLLVGRADDEGNAVVQRVSRSGEVVDVLEAVGSVQATFAGAGDRVAVAYRPSEGEDVVLGLATGGDLAVQELASGDSVVLYASPQAPAGLVAAMITVEPQDPALMVVSDFTSVSIDIPSDDGTAWLQSVKTDAEGRYAYANVTYMQGDTSVASLIAIDLRRGTFEWLVEDWSYVEVADITSGGDAVIVAGVDDDAQEQVIVANFDGTVEFVDSVPQAYRAMFSQDEAQVLFTRLGAEGWAGDVDVVSYERGSNRVPTVMWTGVSLEFAGW